MTSYCPLNILKICARPSKSLTNYKSPQIHIQHDFHIHMCNLIIKLRQQIILYTDLYVTYMKLSLPCNRSLRNARNFIGFMCSLKIVFFLVYLNTFQTMYLFSLSHMTSHPRRQQLILIVTAVKSIAIFYFEKITIIS